MSFSIAYPSIFILLCLLLGAAYAAFLYWRRKDRYENKTIFWILAALRGLAVSSIAFLLLSPIFRNLQNVEEKPTIAILKDNSASQKFAFKSIDSVQYSNDLSKLKNDLAKNYIVKEYSFGEMLTDSTKSTYTEQATNISNAIETVVQSYDNENLAAVILASDGIYNQGANPAFAQTNFNGTIYSIGIGDTTIQKDAAVSRVFANKIVYLNDQFAIRSDVSVFAGQGKSLNVSIYSHSAGRTIANKSISVSNNRFSSSIESIVSATRAGLHRYTVRISAMDGERNLANNQQDVFVEVLDNKEKILLLANAPHPDIAAIKNALSNKKNYKLTVQTADKLNVKASDYNLIILHNLPSVRFNINSLIAQAKRAGVSLWYIAGIQTAIPLLNKQQDAIQIAARGASGADAFATTNKDFSFFKIKLPPRLNFPPLSTPFGNFKEGSNTQTLFYQQIGSVSTNYPLWILQTGTRGKTAVLAGEGLWRWRMNEYEKNRNYAIVDDLISKTAQFLSVKNDKRKFRLSTQQSVYNERDAITFDAELFNENYELINAPDVNLNIKDSSGKVYKYTMDKNGSSYSLNIGALGAGRYSYSANTSYNGRTQTASGNIQVIAQNIEEMNTTADFGMLNELAKNHNGAFVFANQIASLLDKVKSNENIKTVLRRELTTFPLIDKKWIFFLLFGLLALEWFLRKRFGSY